MQDISSADVHSRSEYISWFGFFSFDNAGFVLPLLDNLCLSSESFFFKLMLYFCCGGYPQIPLI